MTEEQAKAFVLEIAGVDGVKRLERFLALVVAENQRQNLIAPSTISSIWARHAADSVQLIRYAPVAAETWLDIGTGGGFPGFAIALLADYQMTLIEPRRRRAEFLSSCVELFDLTDRVCVEQRNIERMTGQYDVISARAVGSVRKLLQGAEHCGRKRTQWILPRGRLTEDDGAVLSEKRAMFHVEQSLTDVASSILVIEAFSE